MSEREKQNRFIKELIRSDNSDQCREFQARISKAERDERCIRSAVFLVMIMALISGAGLGYSAVLVPEFFENSTPMIVRVFSALVLACLICLLGFSGFWWWYRKICNRLYNECRNWIMSLREQPVTPQTSLPSIVHKQGVQLYTVVTSDAEQETQIITFPHASF